MAIITRENIGLLNDKLVINISKEDYLPSFEKSLKTYAKSANIPGFRKGMVPASMIKKMYGQSAFIEEVFRSVEKELNEYIKKEQLNIFAQPLPLDKKEQKIDVNNPSEYVFSFEIGLKPEISIDLADKKFIRYKVELTDEMITDEIHRLQIRNGKIMESEVVENNENVLDLQFTETDIEGNVTEGGIDKLITLPLRNFKEDFQKDLIGKKKGDELRIQLSKAFDDLEIEKMLTNLGLDKNSAADKDKFFTLVITKIGLLQKSALNEAFFDIVYPDKEIKTEEDLRSAIKAEIEDYYSAQSSNQLHDQIYHYLIEHTPFQLPEGFLKRWLHTGAEKRKTDEEVEQEYPAFVNQLKWSLISNKLIDENNIKVEGEEIKQHAYKQMLNYMGNQRLSDTSWLDEYADRMLKDKKFVEETYFQLQIQKLFQLLESRVQTNEEPIGVKEFAKKLEHHHH